MNDPFDKAWKAVKADDDAPDSEKWRKEGVVGEGTPEGFFHSLRNNPKVMDLIGEQGENLASINPEIHTCKACEKRTGVDYEDVWNEDYCSQRCADGLEPDCKTTRGINCALEDLEVIDHRYDSTYSKDSGMDGHLTEIQCRRCNKTMSGFTSEV
jgi:hypothetical protein